MSELNVALLTVGTLVLVLGLFSRALKRTILALPMLAVGTGVLVGPAGLGWVHPAEWGDLREILEQTARLTLGVGLMGVALRLPTGYPLRQARSLAVLLGLGMPLMAVSAGLLVHWVLGVPSGVALLVGAVVSPTDPIVATSIVTGQIARKNLPEHLRNILSAESGANDGLAYPIVLLPALLLTRPAGEAWLQWGVRVVLWEVGAAVLFGALLGLAGGRLLRWAEAEQMMEARASMAFPAALAFLTLAGTKLLGTDGILAVFAAGVTFRMATDGARAREREEVQETFGMFFTLPVFALFGASLPWGAWGAFGWRGVALCAAVLLLRRLPIVLLLQPITPELRDRKDALFSGWFGPIGVAALFYATFALGRAGFPEAWTVGSLLIFASVLAHGVTASSLANLYGRRRQEESAQAQ